MNVSLTTELKEMVEEKVKSGLYQTASEVVRDALRLLKEHDRERDMKLKALRREIAIGIKQAERGQIAPLDMTEILAESRRRAAKKRKNR